jgi:hypothetical protein
MFNISQSVDKYHIPIAPDDISFRIAYGFMLVGFFLALACLAFQRKDIIA